MLEKQGSSGEKYVKLGEGGLWWAASAEKWQVSLVVYWLAIGQTEAVYVLGINPLLDFCCHGRCTTTLYDASCGEPDDQILRST